MGKHVAQAHRSRQVAGKILLVGALGVAGATATQAYADSQKGIAPGQSTGSGAPPAVKCTESPQLRLVVAPELQGVVSAALSTPTATKGCYSYVVAGSTARAVASQIRNGQVPDLWVPDSSTWLDAVNQPQSPAWTAGPSLTRSPVLVASPAKGKGALAAAPSSWSELINVKGDPQLANPDNDTASRLAFFTSRIDQRDAITRDTAARLIFMSRFAKDSVGVLLDEAAANPTAIRSFPVAEQRLATFDAEHPGMLTAFAPKAGTMVLDYPAVTSPSLSADRREAVANALEVLQSQGARTAYLKAGFRDATGTKGPSVGGVSAPAVIEVPMPAAAERKAAIEQWDVLRTDSRMLAIVDVSGSMKYPAKGTKGLTRAQVTEGSLLVALKVLPGGSQIGGWAFSTHLNGRGVDYKEYADVKTLTTPYGTVTWREHLMDVVRTIPQKLKGDTGLYDTTWAAYAKMQATYNPKFVNSVVIFTDGENDDPQGGLSLKQLLDKLAAARDPKRPVRVVTIGMGEADARALQAISQATGGTSYIANTPQDIQRVFVEALLARTKTPTG